MSILIRGMEMPGNCTDCRFRKTARHEYLSDCQLCPFTGDTTPYLTRDKKCPLVPVPPHGRLIDADALMKEMDKQENAMFEHGHEFSFSFKSGGDVCTAWYNVEMMVEDAPTIIEAEGEET